MQKLNNYWVRLYALVISLVAAIIIISVVTTFIAIILLALAPALAVFISSLELPKSFDGLRFEFD